MGIGGAIFFLKIAPPIPIIIKINFFFKWQAESSKYGPNYFYR